VIQPNIDIKKLFQKKFILLLNKEPALKELFFNIFIYGTAYVVGGYLRDILNEKESRDIDIIIDIENVKLLDILAGLKIDHEKNRHGGIKFKFGTTTVDLWSLENNWAFKNKLVKLNEKDKLNSIAKGCFFNYDSLVINVHNYSYNTRNYNDFFKTQTLDILQKSPIYKNLNPTVEANIIRAFFLKQKLNIEFSQNLTDYLAKKIASLSDQYENGLERIINIKTKYLKYQELSDDTLSKDIVSFMDENRKSTNKLFF
jgi:Poly A polymerase head domain.